MGTTLRHAHAALLVHLCFLKAQFTAIHSSKMGYKKYSPFCKSIKILLLLSFMYFTARLDAVDLSKPRIPVTINEFEYEKLPVYCKESTNHFTCKSATGEAYCLPNSLKCRVKCTNDAELNCEHSAAACQSGQFACAKQNGTSQLTCIQDEYLCDGRVHCPLGDDEGLGLCHQRACDPTSQFSCQSPGHCVPINRKCDGHWDCVRTGLQDLSDELNCPATKQLTMTACGTNEFACHNDKHCVNKEFRCDGFRDCTDGSDETNCTTDCTKSEFLCDGRCMDKKLMCNGRLDCADGADELECKFEKCTFDSEFKCRNANKCVSKTFLCDTNNDCGTGDDEVCPIGRHVCKMSSYWTCRSGQHCIPSANRCDSIVHCPDGSDEMDCPTTVPPPGPMVCPPGYHLCNGTRTCVDTMAACSGTARCPQPDAELDAVCRNHRSARDPCKRGDNGGCEQLCESFLDNNQVVPRCTCSPGYQPSPSNPRRCVDINECDLFGSCDQLCTNSIGSYECSCLHGYVKHGSSCLAPGSSKLLYSTDSAIEYLDLESNTRVVVHSEYFVKYLAYDYANRRIFYHNRAGNVGAVQIDGSNDRTILNHTVIDAIAYDWTRGLLFYTHPRDDADSGASGYIGVINVTSGWRAVVRVLDCPRGLVVDPELFTVYVTMWCGARPGIYSMRMDGSDFRLLLDPNGLPGYLAIDMAQSPARLYWTDMRRQGIYSATVEGRDLRVHVHKQSYHDLAIFQDSLYMTRLQQGRLYSTSKFVPDSQIVSKNVTSQSMLSVTVYHSLVQSPPRSPLPQCSCQHICLAPPAGPATCLCDADYRADADTGSCIAKPGLSRRPSVPQKTPSLETLGSGSREASQSAGGQQPLETRVGSIAGIVIGALCVCLILGVAVAMYCLRVQDRQSVSLVEAGGAKCKDAGAMPKVNSRTPLTECEIETGQERENNISIRF